MINLDTLIEHLRPSPDHYGSLYKQLSQSLNEAIRSKMLNRGDVLPAERELAEKLNISRITVRKAIAELVNIGLLSKQQGAGTVVTDSGDLSLHNNLASLTSFTNQIQSRGLESHSRVVLREEGRASTNEAVILHLEEGAFVHRLSRIRYLGDEPISFETAIVPASIVSINTALEEPLYETLRKNQMHPIKAKQNIQAINADEEIAKKLGIREGSAVLSVERRSQATCGTMVEYTISYCRGDRYDFVVELG